MALLGGELHTLLSECVSYGPECRAAGPSHRLGGGGGVVAAAARGGVARSGKRAQWPWAPAERPRAASTRVRAADQSACWAEKQTQGVREWTQDAAQQVRLQHTHFCVESNNEHSALLMKMLYWCLLRNKLAKKKYGSFYYFLQAGI